LKSLVIERKKLISNINKIFEIAKQSGKNDEGKKYEIIAVVKGNGYGLGMVNLSKILLDNGIHFLAVSTVEEALELKDANLDGEVMLLSSVCDEKEVKELIDRDIILTIGSKEAAELVNRLANQKKVKCQVKIDTGFGRYGFIYNKFDEILEVYKNYSNLEIIGTFSHFAQSYAKDERHTKKQFDRFIDVIEFLKNNKIEPGMLHICNSAAFLRYPNMRLNAARIGSAFLGRILVNNYLKLERIGYLETKIIETNTLPKGYTIRIFMRRKNKKRNKNWNCSSSDIAMDLI